MLLIFLRTIYFSCVIYAYFCVNAISGPYASNRPYYSGMRNFSSDIRTYPLSWANAWIVSGATWVLIRVNKDKV